MDFNEILAQWEASQEKGAIMDDGRSSSYTKKNRPPVSQLKRMRPQRVLDLHGSTAEEARESVHEFLKRASADGIWKVLIIHGKGYHSKSGIPVLRRVVYECLDESPYAGKRGIPDRTLGGSGAVWVFIKQAGNPPY